MNFDFLLGAGLLSSRAVSRALSVSIFSLWLPRLGVGYEPCFSAQQLHIFKHLAVQLHHFRQYILDKTITVIKVDTKYQRADIMTKALPHDPFQFLHKTITGWRSTLRIDL